MKLFKLTIPLFFILFVSAEWKDDLKILKRKYSNAHTMEMEMLTTLKDSKGRVYESFTSKMIKSGSNLYYKGIDYELVVGNTERVMIVKEEKLIHVYPGVNHGFNDNYNTWLMVLDSSHYFTNGDVTFKKLEGGSRMISYSLNNSEFVKIELDYSIDALKVNKARMFLKKEVEDKKGAMLIKPYVEIILHKQKLNHKVPEETFNTSRYVYEKQGKYYLSEKYKSYSLYTHPKTETIDTN